MARSARGAVAFAKLAAKPRGLGEGAWPRLEGGRTRPAIRRSMGSAAGSAASPAAAWGSAAARCPGCARHSRRRIPVAVNHPRPRLGPRACVCPWYSSSSLGGPCHAPRSRETNIKVPCVRTWTVGPWPPARVIAVRALLGVLFGADPACQPSGIIPNPVPRALGSTEASGGIHSRVPCLSVGAERRGGRGEGAGKTKEEETWHRAGTRGPFPGFCWVGMSARLPLACSAHGGEAQFGRARARFATTSAAAHGRRQHEHKRSSTCEVRSRGTEPCQP